MVKPVSLSDPAFAALREEKRPGESDSDVVLRLIKEAQAARKDPWHFVKASAHRKKAWTAEEHLENVQRMRQIDRERANEKWRRQHGSA